MGEGVFAVGGGCPLYVEVKNIEFGEVREGVGVRVEIPGGGG